ncbi:MAG TPA: hypothetical protein VK002_04355 [Rubricoccaceae bacterium]|jgi:hypothetical protein|nr:hypothetical protein [Rubricoccaceae bacterium]
MLSVPFEIGEVHGGFSEAHGVAYVEDEYLVLEVQTAFLGMFKKDPRTYWIDLTDLESVRYKRGLRKDRLTLRASTLDVLDAVPGVQKGELRLLVRRKDRGALDVLLDRLDLWRAD